MSHVYRRLSLALLAGVVGLCALGCDAATLAYFFMPEQRDPGTIKTLASQDPKKEPRVAIFTWAGLETRSEFIHADRQISELLATRLRTMAEDNKEKLAILQPRKVEDYKNTHPSWRSQSMTEIGRQLKVDYVIYLEINSLTMFEPGSANQLFRGRANLTVTLYDVNKPDETPEQQAFSCVYPSEAKGPIPTGFDSSPMQFRQMFLAEVARKLSHYFSSHQKHETWRSEQ